jgi:periplasmic divalent cation tolerance protein
MNKFIIVFVTVKNKKEAEKIANILLNSRLAACINIVPLIQSRYWWKGKIEKSNESLLIIKTRKNVIKQLIKTVKENHSYTVPEIISVPIIHGNVDYLNWIEKEVKI